MKLSRKRPVPQKESTERGEDDKAESKQTKISRFFSKALLPSTHKDSTHSESSKLPQIVVDHVDEVCEELETEEIIGKTPEVDEKHKMSRFCRLKKLSKTKLSAAKSSSKLLSVKNSSPVLTSTPTTMGSPPPKRRVITSTSSSEEMEISPVSRVRLEVPTYKENDDVETGVRPTQLKTAESGQAPVQPVVDDKKSDTVDDQPLTIKYGRHRVTKVDRPRGKFGEIQLDLESDDRLRTSRRCVLKGSWINTDVIEGDLINLLEVSESNTDSDGIQTFTVDDLTGLVVVHPDLLLSGTSVVSSLFCMRKAIISERYKGFEGNNCTMFVGTLVHILLQECLRSEARCQDDVLTQLNSVLQMTAVRLDMLSLDLTEDTVRKEVEPFLPHIKYFIEKYVMGRDTPIPPAAYSNTGGGGSQRSFAGKQPPKPQEWAGQVEAIKDIEENIWSPRLGIKGKVDITVQVKLHQRDKKGRHCKTVPLELKTGRPSGSVEHRGQVILYSMMMSERRPDPECGLLLYLRTSSLQEVQAGINEMRGLVQLRNELVRHLRNYDKLPDPINLRRACEQCPHLQVCAADQKIKNSIPLPPHSMSDLVPQALDHLQQEDLDFFRHWTQLVSLESSEVLRSNRVKNLWCLSPLRRESNLSAVVNLKLKECVDATTSGPLEHTFIRENPIPANIFSVGDVVIVSTDSAIALSQGTIRSVHEDHLRIALDRNLAHWSSSGKEEKFHVDRYEYQSTGGGYNLNNLAHLMSNREESERLRRIIVTKSIKATFLSGLPKEVALKGKHILRPLNRVQQKAIFRTIMAEEYVLIRGMPGSGKTTAIVALIRLLVALGKSVLLTSYTHAAVDNVLVKLLQQDVTNETPFLRVGQVSRIHSKVLPHSADYLARNFKGDLKSLKGLFDSRPIVASTCLGISHPAIAGRKFDYCIFDEAGQSLLLATIGPLFNCQKFVLVGDPQQLPPVVQNPEARGLGLEKSLFEHLQDEENVIPLTLQYRMNKTIQAVANHLTYDDQLECGSEEVATKTLDHRDAPFANVWLSEVVDSSIDKSVVFIDTSGCSPTERNDDSGPCNDLEASIVALIIVELQKMSISGHSPTIGVIAPYRSQVSNLRKKLSNIVQFDAVNTVDQFQGRDNDVIIYSCTRCRAKVNDDRKSVDILSDERRLNVAVTRAKAKLIIVGHQSALRTFEPFEKLISFLQNRNSIVKLQSEDIH